MPATSRVVGAVADQGESGVGGLDADLMFAPGLQPEPQFAHDAFAAGERIFRDDFVMCDGFLRVVARGLALRFRKHMLAQLVPAQSQPLPPCACGRAWTTCHKSHIFPLHGVRLQLLDEVTARGGIRGHAKDAAGVLIEPMNRQGFKPAIRGRQRFSGDAAILRLQFSRQEIGEDAQRGKLAIRRRHGNEAGSLVDDGQGGIQIKQRDARMNLPAGTAIQRGGWRPRSSKASPGSGMVWWGLRMTTPLTLTRPARIHCLARLFGVSGCFRNNQSNSGLIRGYS